VSTPEGPWSRPPSTPPPRRSRRGLWIWLSFVAVVGGGFLLAVRLFPAESADLDWERALRLFGTLALVSSALVSARRFSLSSTVRAIAGWIAILAVLITAYALRNDVSQVAVKVRSALFPAYAVADSPRSLVISRGDSDGFYVMGKVNGAPVRFLIDTGSTEILLSPADAERAGLRPGELDYSRPSETANGVGYGASGTVDTLTVGAIRMDHVPVSINKAPMDASLLGMPFLKRLDSYEVRGDQMYLRSRD
jgi:aspartyl protease family protein